MDAFLNCLFDKDEATCFSQTPRGTRVSTLSEVDSRDAFFSINPLPLDKDTNPHQSWHAENKGRRADCNVTCYRNILIEMDKIALDKQVEYIKEIAVPYSTAVYSGGKSIHYVISLQDPVQNQKEYRRLTMQVYKAVGEDYVDTANKNPSRLSRLPGHVRIDTGKEQRLLAINGRIPKETLRQWIASRGVKEDSMEWEEITLFKRSKHPAYQSSQTKAFLANGAANGSRNLALFKAAADLCRLGYTQDEAMELLRSAPVDLDEIEFNRTVASAYRNEENQR